MFAVPCTNEHAAEMRLLRSPTTLTRSARCGRLALGSRGECDVAFRRLAFLALALTVCSARASVVEAQSTFATLTGTVTDQSGVLPGATVTVTNTATGGGADRLTTGERASSRCPISTPAPTACSCSSTASPTPRATSSCWRGRSSAPTCSCRSPARPRQVEVTAVSAGHRDRAADDRQLEVGRRHQQAGAQLPRHQQHQPDRRRHAGAGRAAGSRRRRSRWPARCRS